MTPRPVAPHSPPPREGPFTRLLTWRRAPVLVVLLGLALALPSLAVGFCTDDYAFRAALASRHPLAPRFYDLYRFTPGGGDAIHDALVRAGRLPWWSARDFELHLLRPLSSALFALDDALFGDHAAGYHLHALAWYVALLAAVGLLYRRILPGPSALLALLVYALKGAHTQAYAWISARHLLVSAVPCVLALVATVRAREEGWRPGRWLAPLALVLGLLGGEAAVGGIAFVLAYAIASADRGSPGEARSPWPRRLVAAAPAALLLVVYLAAYRVLGGGARGSGAYLDPIASPGPFTRAALVRLPVLLGDALLGIPAELSNVMRPAPLVVAGGLGVVLFALLAIALAPRMTATERRALGWLVPGAVLGVGVGISGFPGGRLLVLPDVGLAALVGVLVHRGLERPVEGARRLLSTAGAALLAIVHVGLAPLLSMHDTARLVRLARGAEQVAREAEWPAPAGNRVLVVASDPMVFLYPRGILAQEAPDRIRCWSVLSAAKAPHRLTRTGERSFALEPLGRPLLEGPFEVLFRPRDRAFVPGDTIRQCGVSLRVAAVEGGRPTRLDVDLEAPLDPRDAALLVWREGRLRRVVLPPLGQSIELPWSPGPSRHL